MSSIEQAHALPSEENDQIWLQRIDEWRVSGQSIAEWVREHGEFSYDQFRRARKRLFPEGIQSIGYTEEETTWTSLSMEIPTSSFDLYVNECRLVVKTGFDQELLREVVEVLKSAP